MSTIATMLTFVQLWDAVAEADESRRRDFTGYLLLLRERENLPLKEEQPGSLLSGDLNPEKTTPIHQSVL